MDTVNHPQKPSSGGPGILAYIGVGVVLVGAMGVLQFRAQIAAKNRARSKQPVEFSKTENKLTSPSKSVVRPRNVRGTAPGALVYVQEEVPAGAPRPRGSMLYVAEGRARSSKRQGSMAYLHRDQSIKGVVDDADQEAFGGGSAGRLRRLIQSGADGPPLTMTGDRGSAKPGRMIIRDKNAWDLLWRSTGGHDMPDLNFKSQMGIVVFAGTQPAGTSIQIMSARPKGNRFVVEYVVLKPLRRQLGKKVRPFQLMVVPSSTLRPYWVKK